MNNTVDIRHFVGKVASKYAYDLSHANWNMTGFLIEVMENDLSKLDAELQDYYKAQFFRTAMNIEAEIPKKLKSFLSK